MTTVKQLTLGTLPRIAKLPPTGTTILQAINYIQSLIAKRMMKRRSDLLIQSEYTWTVTPATPYYDLPSGFISLAEKPFNPDYSGDYYGESWDGTELYGRSGCLQPLTGGRSQFEGQTALSPYKYELIGTQIAFYPALDASLVSVDILARYFGLPTDIAGATEVIDGVVTDVNIPFNGLFDMVFYQGVPQVVIKGLEVIQADPAFETVVHAEVDSVLDARALPLPRRRMKRGDFY